MELFINLVDNANVVHDDFYYEFDSETTLIQLKNRINSKWNISKDDQKWFFENGQKLSGLGDRSLISFGLKHGSKVIVRHSMTAYWEAFMRSFESARQASALKQMPQIEQAVDQALNHLMPLKKAEFLVTYPQFGEIYCQFRENFSRYMKREFEYIEIAAKFYFSKFFADQAECPAPDIRCEKKRPEDCGIQGGLICQVLRNEILIGQYYVKENMGLANWQSADIREIFIYKLFELIGVGPKVHFIPHKHYSSFALYIGADEVPGFRRAYTEGIHVSSQVYAQRDLLRRVLFVKDLHWKSYGIDGHGKLSIVDFRIRSCVDPEMAHKYLNGYKSWKGSKELWIQVAKDCIKLWNLPHNFNKANEAISMQKELFKQHSIICKPNRNFEKYFVEINNNLNSLIESLK